MDTGETSCEHHLAYFSIFLGTFDTYVEYDFPEDYVFMWQ